MTQPINHRAAAEAALSRARSVTPAGSPAAVHLGILHVLLAVHDILAELRDEDRYDVDPDPHAVDPEGPDIDDTVETPRYRLAHIPDTDLTGGVA